MLMNIIASNVVANCIKMVKEKLTVKKCLGVGMWRTEGDIPIGCGLYKLIVEKNPQLCNSDHMKINAFTMD